MAISGASRKILNAISEKKRGIEIKQNQNICYLQVRLDDSEDLNSTAATMAGHTQNAQAVLGGGRGGGAETTTTNLMDVVDGGNGRSR